MVKNEESRRSMKIENNPVASSDADSSVASASAVAMTTGPLTPIQQQPSGQTRRVRDELDPAPHHTPSDIRVLEILKRIRDEGNVGDEDSPPPKRKPGRTRMADRPSFTRQTPAPVLPQPNPSVTTATTSSSSSSSTSTAIHPLDSFKVPLSATVTPTTNLRPRGVATPPAQFRNGTPSTILLTTTNGTATAVPVTTSLIASGTSVTSTPTVTVIQQKPQPISVTKAPPNVASTTQQSNQQIGLELILPNGIRIPVSATACTPKSETRFTPISAAPPPSQKTGALVTTVPITPSSTPSKLWSPPQISQPQTPQSTTVATTTPSAPLSITSASSNSQQVCSCSRSKCLKLYCDCFAAGRACGESCNCRHCYNNLADDVTKQTRDVAMRTALSRNPLAFKPKIETSGKHVLGCRCKRSHCLKGYCECYLAKIPCNQRCRCLGCSNEEASSTPGSMVAASTGNTATVTTNATPSAPKPANDVQMTWLTSPSPCQQVAVTAANTVSVVTASPVSVVKANIAPNTGVSTEIVNATAPRTITLNVPIKTLTATNGSTNVLTAQPTGQSSNASTTSEMPPMLFSQTYLAAVAAAGPSAQQNFLKCLNSVLPQGPSSNQSVTQFIIPGLVQATAAPASQSSEGELTLIPISKLSSPVMVKTESIETSLENTNNGVDGGESVNGLDDIEHSGSYAGYTEEELAFMQRLQQDRNNNSEVISQVKKEYTVMEAEPIGESFSPTHSEPPSHQNPSENVSMSLPSMIASLLRGPQLLASSSMDVGEQRWQQSEEEPSADPLSPQSAPPSLCPSNGTEERANLPSRKSNEARFLKQKVFDLEAQIYQLTELIRTQGEVMSHLSDTIQRLQQQYQTPPPPHQNAIISSNHEHQE